MAPFLFAASFPVLSFSFCSSSGVCEACIGVCGCGLRCATSQLPPCGLGPSKVVQLGFCYNLRQTVICTGVAFRNSPLVGTLIPHIELKHWGVGHAFSDMELEFDSCSTAVVSMSFMTFISLWVVVASAL